MLVSIITTCFNFASTISQTIDSVLTQVGDFELEYIITDAGSCDGTLEIARSHGMRIKLIDATGSSQVQGINLGIQQSRGTVVTFLNSDDTYEPGAINHVIEEFKQHPESLWLVGQCRIIDGHGQERDRWITAYKNLLLNHYSYFLLLTENFICQPSVFLKRQVFADFGFFWENENYAFDYEFWLRLGLIAPPIICRRYLASFRRTSNTLSNTHFVRQFEDDLRLGIHYSTLTNNRLAIPIKYLNYFKTVSIYSLLYKK